MTLIFNPESKKGVDKAGNYLSRRARNTIEYTTDNDSAAFQTMDLWRRKHKGPLNSIRQQVVKIVKKLGYESTSVIVTRLKRATSILSKLERNTSMELAQMQDIAGARVILKDQSQVEAFYNLFVVANRDRESNSRYIVKKVSNYVSNPKFDGYKSIHIICEYRAKNALSTVTGRLVELQVRTRYQHIWATAVEAMGLYQGVQLKSGEGEQHILEFFRLCAAAISMIEGSPLHEDFKCISREEIKAKLIKLEEEAKIFSTLQSFNAIDNVVENNLAKADLGRRIGCFLFILNKNEKKLRVRPFLTSEFKNASSEYKRYEDQIRAGAPLDVVLITSSDRNKLKKAYPNYYADTRLFCYIIQRFAFL